MTHVQVAPSLARFPLGRVALVWALLAVLILLVNVGGIATRRFPDPDDMLRLVQVRDLLAGQGWFDLHQYRIDPPNGTLMHWSRLVDIPLAVLIALLAPLIGQPAAEWAALLAVPLLTLGAIVLVVARIAARFFDKEVMTFACLALGLSPLLVAQVQPLRIDHHGWQIFAVMVALIGLLPGRGWKGAALSGVALAFGLSISLEVLPIAAGFGAVFALRWLISRDHLSLPVFMGALTGGLGMLFVATRGFTDLALHCDVVSPAHLALLGVTSALAWAVAWVRPRSPVLLVGLLGVAGAAGLGVYLLWAPHCAAGPFGGLDPLVRRFWYENVLEGLPTWRVAPLLSAPVVVSGLVGLGVLAHLARMRPAEERRWWLEYLAVAGAAFATALLVWRSQAFVGALSAVPLGWLAVRLLARMRNAGNALRRLAAGLTVILVLLPGFPTAVAGALIVGNAVQTGKMSKVSDSNCRLSENVHRLNRLPAGTIFAPLDIGPALIDLSHHSVVATGHHRGAPAMRDVIVAFTSPANEAQQLIRTHGARYVVMCADLAEPLMFIDEAPGGLAADLFEGRAPDWLEPIDVGAPTLLKVWRVRD